MIQVANAPSVWDAVRPESLGGIHAPTQGVNNDFVGLVWKTRSRHRRQLASLAHIW